MGGRIWVESQLGKGSQFHFVLSLSKIDDIHRAFTVTCDSEREVRMCCCSRRTSTLGRPCPRSCKASGFQVLATGECGGGASASRLYAARPRTAAVSFVIDLHADQLNGDWNWHSVWQRKRRWKTCPSCLLMPAGQMDAAERCT